LGGGKHREGQLYRGKHREGLEHLSGDLNNLAEMECWATTAVDGLNIKNMGLSKQMSWNSTMLARTPILTPIQLMGRNRSM
jgi:hypothetical protein